MDAIDRTTAAGLETMHFGRGGFQAGQATRACAAFYVENVLEELDEGGEYFCRPPQTSLPSLPVLAAVGSGTGGLAGPSGRRLRAPSVNVGRE